MCGECLLTPLVAKAISARRLREPASCEHYHFFFSPFIFIFLFVSGHKFHIDLSRSVLVSTRLLVM